MLLGQIEGSRVGLGLGHAELFSRRDVEDLPAKALVAEEGADVLEAGKAPVPVFLPEKGGLGCVALGVKGIRILEERGIARVGARAAMGRDVGDWLKLKNSAHGSGFA